MVLFSSRNHGCKGFISEASPSNQLARTSSQIASSRSLKGGLIDNPACALLAVFFFGLTCRVIFEDVLIRGAEVTTDHLLSFGVLVGTFAAGHYFLPALIRLKLLSAFGFLVLFAAGTYYCVTISAGRNALAQLAKSQDAVKANEERASLKRQQSAAALEMERAEAVYQAAQEEADEADKIRAQKCDDGVGKFCRGARENAKVAAEKAAKRKAEYEAAKAAYWALDTKLAIKTEKQEHPTERYTANLLSRLPWVTAPVDKIEEAIVLFVPFGKALFCEGATLIFAGFGFGHGSGNRSRRKAPTATADGTPAPPEERNRLLVPRDRPIGRSHGATVVHLSRSGTVPAPQSAALVLLRQHLAVRRTVPQSDLTGLFGDISKQTVSRWLDEWERQGFIERIATGRTKQVALARSNGTAAFRQ